MPSMRCGLRLIGLTECMSTTAFAGLMVITNRQTDKQTHEPIVTTVTIGRILRYADVWAHDAFS